MKKFLVLSVFAAVFSVSQAVALDSTGCGLGSIIFKGQAGTIPQLLAVTTNGTLGTQTFGISLGTSGCDQNGRVSGGTGRIFAFLEKNLEQFAVDAARGQGETIDTIAGLLDVDSAELGAKAQKNFAYLFTDENVEAVDLTLKIMELAQA